MISRKVLKKLEESLDDIRSLMRAFEHAAARKMDVNRREIDKLAASLREAVDSYSNAKVAYSLGKGNSNLVINRPSRTPGKIKVMILVTSESKYPGNLINILTAEFMREFRAGGADGVVIGQAGRTLLTRQGFGPPNVTFFDFDDDKPDWSVVRRVSHMIAQYREIVIYWGQYKSILTQGVRRDDIAKLAIARRVPVPKKYAFEPRAELPLAMLEKQIISSSFLQKLYEAGLAKNAVAVKILEIGVIAERINAAYLAVAKFKVKLNKDINNRKQNQLFASKGIWERPDLFRGGGASD